MATQATFSTGILLRQMTFKKYAPHCVKWTWPHRAVNNAGLAKKRATSRSWYRGMRLGHFLAAFVTIRLATVLYLIRSCLAVVRVAFIFRFERDTVFVRVHYGFYTQWTFNSGGSEPSVCLHKKQLLQRLAHEIDAWMTISVLPVGENWEEMKL